MTKILNDSEDTRIKKLRTYLFTILDTLLSDNKYQINSNMLSHDTINYSLDKIPTQSSVERWTIGIEVHRDIYSLRSRLAYSQDAMNNLKNVGFFEEFESIIKNNNDKGVLPDIKGIESIQCLNCGTMNSEADTTCEFDIQLQIQYRI